MFKKNGIEPRAQHVYLRSPTMHGEEFQYMKEAYDTNWMSTVGANINEVEKCASEKIGCKHAVALSSGTAALHMAIKLAGMDLYGQPEVGHGALEGKRVFCSDMTFDATVNPVSYEHAEQVFIDSETETWNMNPVALKKAFELYPDTKVVIVANLYGTPAKLDEIKRICDENGAVLIEDAAESLGATYKDRQTGTFGKYNAISFNGNKIITTSGGGMLLTDDEDGAKLARKWSTQSREPAPWYQHEDLGYNYRMSNIVAGIGRGQLLHLDENIDKKRKIYMRYNEGFKELPVQMNPFLDCSKPNFWLSCLTVNSDAMCEQKRGKLDCEYVSCKGKSCPDEIRETLAKYNIESRPIWKPMHMQPIFEGYKFISAEDTTDVAADIFNRGLCLPSDIKMTEKQQNIVIDIIKSCFE